MKSERLEGLELLRICDLPTPNWQLIDNHSQIPLLTLDKNEFGWTIRTCRLDGKQETGEYFKNNLQPEEVIKELELRESLLGKKEIYIVYPSWEFFISFNILCQNDTYIVEGMYGSQKNLAMGTANPDICLQFDVSKYRQDSWFRDDYSGDTKKHLKRILGYCSRIILEEYYTEVAVTSYGKIIFYELFPFLRKGGLSGGITM